MGVISEHIIIHTRNRYSYKSKHKYLKINIEKRGRGVHRHIITQVKLKLRYDANI